jgi:hypothetical protein
MGVTQLFLSALLDFPIILAGHEGSITGKRSPDAGSGAEDGGGIGMAPIIAVIVLAVVTVGLLVWLNRQEKASVGEQGAGSLKLRSVAPAGFIAAIIAMPLIVWAASSGGDEEKSLMVERSTSRTGAPEFILTLGEDDLNTLETTNGKRAVRVECLGREGQMVLDAKQRWPFRSKEPGYDYPHTHQAASRQQLQQADRCRLRGTRVRLEAEVEGALTG